MPFLGSVLPLSSSPRAVQLISSFQAHGLDLGPAFSEGGDVMDFVIRFTNNLDPNGKKGLGVPWPQWDPRKPKALILQDDIFFPQVLGDDNYRTDPLNFVVNMSLLYPI